MEEEEQEDKKETENNDKVLSMHSKRKSTKTEGNRTRRTNKTHNTQRSEVQNTGENFIERDNDNQHRKSSYKEKIPIISYNVDSSYQDKLINELKNEGRTRPKELVIPDLFDIRRNIEDLDRSEQIHEKMDEAGEIKVIDTNKRDKEFLRQYKDSSLSGKTLLQDPYALFCGAKKAYIDQFYKLSDLFVICPIYFNYRISLEYLISEEGEEEKKYEAYHLFNTKEISPGCSHNMCSNQSRQIDINIFNFIVGHQEDRFVQKFLTIKKPCRCAFSCFCACCSRPTFEVATLIEELGTIVEIRTVCDPVIHINNINNDLIYIITTKCCNNGYCCRDKCCDNPKCATCEFTIFDARKENELGKITKKHRSGKKVKPDYDQIQVDFPSNCSCQNKILIMCSALVIEYLYFQNMSNTKRCFGNPKFMHTHY